MQVERLALERLGGGGDHAARDGHGHEAPFVVLVRHDGEARVAELADDALLAQEAVRVAACRGGGVEVGQMEEE